jgi:GH24 family phage-related lysozyme (muramidase)
MKISKEDKQLSELHFEGDTEFAQAVAQGYSPREDGRVPDFIWRGAKNDQNLHVEKLASGKWAVMPGIDPSGKKMDRKRAVEYANESRDFFIFDKRDIAEKYAGKGFRGPYVGKEDQKATFLPKDEAFLPKKAKSLQLFDKKQKSEADYYPSYDTEQGRLTREYEGAGKPGKPGIAYPDHKGNWTVGYGYMIKDSKGKERPGARQQLAALGADYDSILSGKTKLSEDQMKQLYNITAKEHWNEAKTLFSNWDDLPREGKDVAFDMTFNMGRPKVGGFVKFRKAVEERDIDQITAQMEDSDWWREFDKLGNDRAKNNVEKMRKATENWK